MFRALEDKFSDFVQESALALYKTVLLCVSALSLGLLPGKGLGNTWPPFQAQVRIYMCWKICKNSPLSSGVWSRD